MEVVPSRLETPRESSETLVELEPPQRFRGTTVSNEARVSTGSHHQLNGQPTSATILEPEMLAV